jgi:hypothetical protein
MSFDLLFLQPTILRERPRLRGTLNATVGVPYCVFALYHCPGALKSYNCACPAFISPGSGSTCISNHWKIAAQNFQSLEKARRKVPTIGKNGVRISKRWKKWRRKFQPLEKSAAKLPTIGNLITVRSVVLRPSITFLIF